MADSKNKNGKTIAVVGGGALLLLLLLRGKGWGLGLGGSGGGGDATDAAVPDAPTPPACRVRVDVDGIKLNGVPADIAATVEGCRPAGAADVLVTGAAVHGVVERLLQALRDAGIVTRIATPYTAHGVARQP